MYETENVGQYRFRMITEQQSSCKRQISVSSWRRKYNQCLSAGSCPSNTSSRYVPTAQQEDINGKELKNGFPIQMSHQMSRLGIFSFWILVWGGGGGKPKSKVYEIIQYHCTFECTSVFGLPHPHSSPSDNTSESCRFEQDCFHLEVDFVSQRIILAEDQK